MSLPAPDPPLSDGEISLRPLTARDLDALGRACADPDLALWLDPARATATELPGALLDQLTDGWRRGRAASLACVASGTGDLHAVVALVFEADPEVAEVAYWVAAPVRGRGIATRAVKLVSAWAFDELGLERLWLEVEPENEASHRVAARSGFRQEGVLRSHCRDRRTGRRHDCVVYSLLPGDLTASG